MKIKERLLQIGGVILVLTAITMLIFGLLSMGGCSTVREERDEQVPGRARTIHIDTRPVPQASRQGTLDTCHPLARALAMASIGVDQPERPETGVKYGRDGSLEVGPGFTGRLTISESEGNDAAADAPPEGGGSAYAKATRIVGSRIKAPPKGVALILIGGLLVAAGVFLGFSKWLTVRSAVGLSLAGGACLACGWLMDSPIAGWLIGLTVVVGGACLALYILDSKGKVDSETALKAVAKAVSKSPDAPNIKTNVDAFAGAAKARVKSTIGKVKAKEKIGGES